MRLPELFYGSSRFAGEGGLDLQKEIGGVAEAISHAFDDLDFVIDAFEDAEVHAIDGRSELAVDGRAIPASPSSSTFTDRRREPDFLEFRFKQIDGSQRRIGRQQFIKPDALIVLEIVAISEQ